MTRPIIGVAWLALAVSPALAIETNKVLFDATKAQMAGNADWVIDSDTFNIGTGSGGKMTVGSGSDANPQRQPTPSQANITASTAETYWKGALSAWGVALVKRGFSVETLPVGGRITYGDATNAQDLSNYGIYIIPEPNIAFTTAEKQAIIRFVQDGGGVFLGGNHSGSDRNNDGMDPVDVFNDLATSNGLVSNPFGILFNMNSYSVTTSTVSTLANDPLIRGAAGTVAQMQYNAGSTMTISGAAKGAIWRTTNRSSSDVMVAYSTYGLGKVVACGDSSPFDDGTGDTGDTLYNGWFAEVNGDHGELAINACLWLNPPAANPCPSDVDGSGSVDGADISLMLLDFGPCTGCASDLDGDDRVSAADIALLLLDFGPCP
jgi:hypothetical protein